MNFKQLAYGLLSFLPGVPESLYRGTGGTSSAEYCYCIWLRHLVLAHQGGMQKFPAVVAELGPGDSIGVGLAALLCGAQRYVALDALVHADPAGNLRVFDDLVTLFGRRAPIPGRGMFPEIALDLDSNAFPIDLIGEQRLRDGLDVERIAQLRRIVSGECSDPTVIDYRTPWEQVGGADADSIDFLLSNAVMEHVSDLETSYLAMAQWLRADGYASHQIDFRSHSLFHAWDGHWACPDWLWTLFVGRRGYLLNRQPFGVHRALAAMSGLVEGSCVRIERMPESQHLAKRFRNIEAADRATCGGYLLLHKLRGDGGA
jgi:hypothetical protein